MPKPCTHNEEVAYYQSKLCEFRQEQFEQLTFIEKLLLLSCAESKVEKIHKLDPTSTIEVMDILDLAISACYYSHFKESPIETAVCQ